MKEISGTGKDPPPPGINIVPSGYTSTTSDLTCEVADDDDSSLIDGTSLALDLEINNLSRLSDDTDITRGYVYLTVDESLGASIETGHTSS